MDVSVRWLREVSRWISSTEIGTEQGLITSLQAGQSRDSMERLGKSVQACLPCVKPHK
jgi:hypothetical protein